MLRLDLAGAVVALSLTFVSSVSSPAAAQTVDEIVARNLEAKGGVERMRAVQTLRQTEPAQHADRRGDARRLSQAAQPHPPGDHARRTRSRRRAHEGGRRLRRQDGVDDQPAGRVERADGGDGAAGRRDARAVRFRRPAGGLPGARLRMDYVGTETVDGRRAYHLRLNDRAKRVQHLYSTSRRPSNPR